MAADPARSDHQFAAVRRGGGRSTGRQGVEEEYGVTYTLTVTDEGGTYSYELRFRGNKEGLLEEVALSSPFIGPDDWDNMDSNIYLLRK